MINIDTFDSHVGVGKVAIVFHIMQLMVYVARKTMNLKRLES